MATHGNPIETVNAIGFTIDTIDDAFELTAFALIGAGTLAFAWVALHDRRADLVDVLLVTGGVVLMPAWLVWSGRLLRRAIPVER
jgi:hypothetical protein